MRHSGVQPTRGPLEEKIAIVMTATTSDTIAITRIKTTPGDTRGKESSGLPGHSSP
jgi:hypothetical protein